MGSALVSARTEGLIDASNEPRPAFPSFGSPRLFRDVEHLAYLLGIRYSSADVSVAPSAHPAYRGWRVAADQQLRTSRLCRRWSHRSDLVAHRLAGPDAPHELELLLEPSGAVVEGSGGPRGSRLPGLPPRSPG